mmetsp:Transcript_66731/g.120097  ORF Transcript_66731/g.120097 Transcript_66731/m.120097 type:complete len:807 (-) Transcript_66731:97-2517(-)
MGFGGFDSDAAARITRKGLEVDGVNSRLFELLWKKDLLSDSSISLRIPDTVVFKYSAPSLWYFTSVDGTIKRKTKAKVNEQHIVEEFLKRPSLSGIVAYYVTTTEETVEQSRELRDDGDLEAELAGTRTTIQYLNEEGLKNFLFNRQQVKPDGILQKFLEPLGGSNNMLRAMWSPKVCMLERRVNRLRVADTRYDMYERAVTFEGPDFHSEVVPVRGAAPVAKVHEIAESIVQHVAAVTNDRMKISRLALNFKVDHKDRTWLLFASSVRLRDELRHSLHLDQAAKQALISQGISNTPLEVNTILAVPDYIRRAQTTSHAAPAVLQKTCRCPTCEDKVQPELLCDLSYKVMIEYEEQKRRIERKRLGADADVLFKAEVPEAMRRLHPRISLEEYSGYRNELAFLQKLGTVCEACFIRFSSSQLGRAQHQRSTPELDPFAALDPEVDQDFAGIQALEPVRLNLRRDATRRRIEQQQRASEDGWFEAQMDVPEKRQERSKSCPKLPSYGPGLGNVPLFPPLPLLSHRPRLYQQPLVPKGPAPPGSFLRQDIRQSDEQRVRRAKTKVPPLVRGDPYLRELQEFTSKCVGRVAEVLGPAAAKSLGSRPLRVRRSASDATLRPQKAKDQADATQARPSSSSPAKGRYPPELDTSDIIELDANSELDPAIEVAQLWGKWPPTCGSGNHGLLGSRRSYTPTTRPPSQGDAMSVGPSSHPTSRPSTRTSSRGPGSAITSPVARARQQEAALQRLRESRPSSSPQIGGGRGPALRPPLGNRPSTACSQPSNWSPQAVGEARPAPEAPATPAAEVPP